MYLMSHAARCITFPLSVSYPVKKAQATMARFTHMADPTPVSKARRSYLGRIGQSTRAKSLDELAFRQAPALPALIPVCGTRFQP